VVRVAVEHSVVVALILFLSNVTLAGVVATATSSSIIGAGALVVVAKFNKIAPSHPPTTQEGPTRVPPSGRDGCTFQWREVSLSSRSAPRGRKLYLSFPKFLFYIGLMLSFW
jgi:hypothetical protein